MINKFFITGGLVVLLLAITVGFKSMSHSELDDAELNALPANVRDAAIVQRDTRLRMQGRSWVFALQGNSKAVTAGDVEKAKLAIGLAGK